MVVDITLRRVRHDLYQSIVDYGSSYEGTIRDQPVLKITSIEVTDVRGASEGDGNKPIYENVRIECGHNSNSRKDDTDAVRKVLEGLCELIVDLV